MTLAIGAGAFLCGVAAMYIVVRRTLEKRAADAE